MRSRMYVGVDPGVKGAIAVVEGKKLTTVSLEHLALHDTWSWIQDTCLPTPERRVTAVIEKVTGYIGEGPSEVKPGSRMFTLGTSFGMMRAFLAAANIPFEEVGPRRWQPYFSMFKKKGEDTLVWKRRLKRRAQGFHLHHRITLSIADAVLLAEYARCIGEGRAITREHTRGKGKVRG